MVSYRNQPGSLKQRSAVGGGGLALSPPLAGFVFILDSHLPRVGLFEVDAPQSNKSGT